MLLDNKVTQTYTYLGKSYFLLSIMIIEIVIRKNQQFHYRKQESLVDYLVTNTLYVTQCTMGI